MEPARDTAKRRRACRTIVLPIGLTLVLCAAALSQRMELRARYWAWRLAHSNDPAEQAALASAICNAADQARWGIAALLDDSDAGVRQFGVVALQAVSTAWARQALLERLADPDQDVRELAALVLARRNDPQAVTPLQNLVLQQPDLDAAQAAAEALARMPGETAEAALLALVEARLDADRRAILVDALELRGTSPAALALLEMLGDQRPCRRPPIERRLIDRLAPWLQARGVAPASAPAPPADADRDTVALRAARALVRLTGIGAGLSSQQLLARLEQLTPRWKRSLTAEPNAPAPVPGG